MKKDIIQKRGFRHDITGDVFDLQISSYPASARYLAEQIGDKTKSLCELCCGIGVSLIEYSQAFERVIGVDIDAEVIAHAKNNIASAKRRNVQLIVGDVSNETLLRSIQTDIVAYDIPYWSDHGGVIDVERQNPDLLQIIERINKNITHDIVVYAPANMDYELLRPLVGTYAVDEVWIDSKHDRDFIYFGNLATHSGRRVVHLQNDRR